MENLKNKVQLIVADNPQDKSYLVCDTYILGEIENRTRVEKTAENRHLQSGDVLMEQEVEVNYYSPDGFLVSPENFKSAKEADEFLQRWIDAYEIQGYYSSVNYGRIPVDEIWLYCEREVFTLESQD